MPFDLGDHTALAVPRSDLIAEAGVVAADMIKRAGSALQAMREIYKSVLAKRRCL